jgi:hypothetical protein
MLHYETTIQEDRSFVQTHINLSRKPITEPDYINDVIEQAITDIQTILKGDMYVR